MKRSVWMCVLVLSAAQASAEVDPYGEFSLLTGSIDGVVARREGIGSRGWGVLAGGGLKLNKLAGIGAEITVQYVSDNESFTQLTNQGTFSSTTTLVDAAPYLALRAPLGDSFSVGANGGYSLIFGSRTIENCINCFSEDLNVDGGLYVEPVAYIGKSGGFQFGASLRHYLGGDMKNMFMIRLVKPF
jgi:hypothetical protein